MEQRISLRACVVLFVTSLFFFYEFGINNIFNVLEKSIATEYHLSGTWVGLVSSMYFWANLIFLIPAGALLDRFSPRALISTALFACAISVLAVAFADQLWLLMLARFIMGIGGAFSFIGCVRIAANWFDPKHMARATGFIVTMGMLGGFMVQTPMQLLIDHIGWRSALQVVAYLGVMIVIVIALVVRNGPPGFENVATRYHFNLRQLGILKSLKLALVRRQNWLCGIFTGSINLPIYVLGALWGVPYLTKVHHLTDVQAATVSSMLYIGTMIGSPVAGWVSDSLGRRKLPMIAGAVISLILIYLIIDLRHESFLVALSLFLLLGLMTSSQVIGYPTLVESNSPMVTSTATCIISMMCVFGGAIAEPLFGRLLTLHWQGKMAHGTPVYTSSNYLFAMNVIPIAFFIGLIAASLVKETYCRHQVP